MSSKTSTPNYTYTVGRRKTATARVRLYSTKHVPGTEFMLVVNDKRIEEYFPGEIAKTLYTKPFVVTNTLGKFSASIKVEGSGKSGQLAAVIHGLARALDKFDHQAYHTPLKKAGLLTRDPRAKERRKVGTGGKARRQKQSPKR